MREEGKKIKLNKGKEKNHDKMTKKKNTDNLDEESKKEDQVAAL